MRLKTTTNHAVRILSLCATSKSERIKAAELADQLDLSEQNVLKIIYLLSRAGFLKNIRGRQGGVTLALPPEKISIGDVVREIEADVGSAAAHQSAKVAGFEVLVDHAFSAFLDVLDQQTLADITKATRKTPRKKKNTGNKTPATRPLGKRGQIKRGIPKSARLLKKRVPKSSHLGDRT